MNVFNVKKALAAAACVLVTLTLVVIFSGMNYLQKNKNEENQFYTVRQLKLKYSYVLIASQESSFKNNLVKAISNHLDSKPILFSVINEAELTSTTEDFWDKIIIVTSVLNNNVVFEIDSYINHHKNPEKVCLVITTDSGKWDGNFRDGVDVITTTSKLRNTNKISEEIIAKIDSVIHYNGFFKK